MEVSPSSSLNVTSQSGSTRRTYWTARLVTGPRNVRDAASCASRRVVRSRSSASASAVRRPTTCSAAASSSRAASSWPARPFAPSLAIVASRPAIFSISARRRSPAPAAALSMFASLSLSRSRSNAPTACSAATRSRRRSAISACAATRSASRSVRLLAPVSAASCVRAFAKSRAAPAASSPSLRDVSSVARSCSTATLCRPRAERSSSERRICAASRPGTSRGLPSSTLSSASFASSARSAVPPAARPIVGSATQRVSTCRLRPFTASPADLASFARATASA